MLKYIGKRQIGIVRCSEHEKKRDIFSSSSSCCALSPLRAVLKAFPSSSLSGSGIVEVPFLKSLVLSI